MPRLGRGVGGHGRQPGMDVMQSHAARDRDLSSGAITPSAVDVQRLYRWGVRGVVGCCAGAGAVGRWWWDGPPVLASLRY
jgi:hypothetical protein